ncbi:MAG: biotin/lipoyl-binding protein [Marinobacter sp.]|nr:biotin/lipoyl-binding protein [Marinobacter sp.]
MSEQQDVGKDGAAKKTAQEAEWLEAEYEKDVPEAQSKPQVETSHSRRSRFGVLIVLLTFVGFGGWATFAHVDGAAVALGEVIVSTQNRNIQHLEGGVVDTIFVDDGDQVEQGDTLITLSDIRAVAELDIIQSQLDEILGEEARLLAERAQKNVVEFPPALRSRKDQPGVAAIIDGQTSLFNSRVESVRGREQILEQKAASLAQQVKGQKAMGESLAGSRFVLPGRSETVAGTLRQAAG